MNSFDIVPDECYYEVAKNGFYEINKLNVNAQPLFDLLGRDYVIINNKDFYIYPPHLCKAYMQYGGILKVERTHITMGIFKNVINNRLFILPKKMDNMILYRYGFIPYQPDMTMKAFITYAKVYSITHYNCSHEDFI